MSTCSTLKAVGIGMIVGGLFIGAFEAKLVHSITRAAARRIIAAEEAGDEATNLETRLLQVPERKNPAQFLEDYEEMNQEERQEYNNNFNKVVCAQERQISSLRTTETLNAGASKLLKGLAIGIGIFDVIDLVGGTVLEVVGNVADCN
jgi:hypothetical protein